jgi:hypothetical protein
MAPLELSRTANPIMHRLANTAKLDQRNSGSRRPSALTQLSQNFPTTGSQNFEAPYMSTHAASMCASVRGYMRLICMGRMTCSSAR